MRYEFDSEENFTSDSSGEDKDPVEALKHQSQGVEYSSSEDDEGWRQEKHVKKKKEIHMEDVETWTQKMR